MTKNLKPERISTEDIRDIWVRFRDEVKRSYPIEQALRDLTGADLKGRGGILTCNCPFHVDKTPSFRVDTGEGLYTCFGAGCGAGGDLFTLFQDVEGLDFPSAVISAATRIGVEVPEEVLRTRKEFGTSPSATRVRKPDVPRSPPPAAIPAPLVPVPEGIPFPRAGVEFGLWSDGDIGKDPRVGIRKFRPEMVHVYRDVKGRPIHVQIRVVGRNIGKFFIPARLGRPRTVCPERLVLSHPDLPKGLAWMMLPLDRDWLKPIYGVEDIPRWLGEKNRKILIVEGEKTRDAGRRLLSDADPQGEWLVLSLMGNGGSAHMADWGPLVEALRTDPGDSLSIYAWPDADPPMVMRDGRVESQTKKFVRNVTCSAALALAKVSGLLEKTSFNGVLIPDGREDKWDLADALDEGWTGKRVLDYLKTEIFKSEDDQMKKIALNPRIDEGEAVDDSPFVRNPAGEINPFDAEFPELLQTDIGDIDVDPAPSGNEGREGNGPRERPEGKIEGSSSGDGDIVDDSSENPAWNNDYFRCLGHRAGANYFLSLRGGTIYALTPQLMRSNFFLHLAPRSWWKQSFPGGTNKDGNKFGIDWDDAMDSLIRGTFKVGPWDPDLEMGTGARMDGGLVTYNLGDRLYVENQGVMPYSDFNGRYHYTTSKVCRVPDFANPFGEKAPEILEFIEIICRLNWRPSRRNISIMALLGWIAISPICGMLRWRPHLWLDGPLGAGKSWIIEKLVARTLGDFCYVVKGNSTESGVRNLLDRRALPLIFDEAEGEGKEERSRMDQILKMARHSAGEGKSVVVKGTPGGGGEKINRVDATFLLCSITPQLEAAADVSRFARAHLLGNSDKIDFENTIEWPAEDLITEEFSSRFIARMILRSTDYNQTLRHMVKAFSNLGLPRRSADVYGALATGAWLLLRDGVPADSTEGILFVAEVFNAIPELRMQIEESSSDKDHVRVFEHLMQHPYRFDSRQYGARTERIGALVEIACCLPGEDDTVISVREARDVLKNIGIRFGIIGKRPVSEAKLCEHESDKPDCLFIHRKSSDILKIFENTPYARSYGDVISQAEGVDIGCAVRFGQGTTGVRPAVVPLKYFFAEQQISDRKDDHEK